MLYNVPSRTVVGIEIETAKRLSEIPNIYAIKEASGSMDRVCALANLDSSLKVFSGDDMMNYSILSYGGSGVISVTGNLLPRDIANLCHSAMSGDLSTSFAISKKLYAINRALFVQSNPIPIKAAMYLQGLIKSLEYRLPLCEPSKECVDLLEKTLKDYEVQE